TTGRPARPDCPRAGWGGLSPTSDPQRGQWDREFCVRGTASIAAETARVRAVLRVLSVLPRAICGTASIVLLDLSWTWLDNQGRVRGLPTALPPGNAAAATSGSPM